MTTNIDHFNKLVGLILADLYEQFPVTCTLNSDKYVEKFQDELEQEELGNGLVIDYLAGTGTTFEELFSGTVTWLIQVQFLYGPLLRPDRIHKRFDGVQLTENTLRTLYKTPDSLKSEKTTWGDRIKSVSTHVGKKGGDASIAAVVRELISNAL